MVNPRDATWPRATCLRRRAGVMVAALAAGNAGRGLA
jgi:hypothetical protein